MVYRRTFLILCLPKYILLSKHFHSHPIIIAIDGYSSCGKSTLAKQIAKEFNLVFVDTGAMYRATTLYFIRNGIDISQETEINKALSDIEITFVNQDGYNITFLNGEDVESEIRSLSVSKFVSEVSALSPVRRRMVALQRAMAGKQGLVMDGRDIGTVVFPNADIKFFVVADPIVRAQRRYNEMISKNQQADLQDVISNLAHRDKIDTERDDSPLVKAKDAILIDNTHLSISEQFSLVTKLIQSKIDNR